MCDFWTNNVSSSRMAKPNVLMTQNETLLKMNKLKRQIPLALYKRFGFLVDKQANKKYNRMVKTVAKGE